MSTIFGRILLHARGRGLWIWLGFYICGLVANSGGLFRLTVLSLLIPPLVVLLIVIAFLRRRRLLWALMIAAAFLLGMTMQSRGNAVHERGRRLLDFTGSGKVRIIFRVEGIPARYSDYAVFLGEVESINRGEGWQDPGARTRLSLGFDARDIYAGDRVLALASFQESENFGNPGGFDYTGYLARRGIAASGWVRSSDDLVRVHRSGTLSLMGAVDRLRSRWLLWLKTFPGRGTGLVSALIAGDRESLDTEVEDAFAETGLSHVLAISGLHLGLVCGFIYFTAGGVFRRIGWIIERIPPQKAAALATMPVVIAYALMSGLRLPTQRALVMVLSFLIALTFDKERDPWNALALAAAVIVFIWPMALYEASFQLTFCAVTGILYAWPRLAAVVRGERSEAEAELDRLEASLGGRSSRAVKKAVAYGVELLLISMVAQWSVFALQADLFHAANPLAPLYNVVVVPLLGFFILPFGLMSSFLVLAWPEAGAALMQVVVWSADLLVDGVVLLAGDVPSFYMIPPLSWRGVVCWYGGGIFLLEGLFALRTMTWSWRFFSPEYFRGRLLKLLPAQNVRAVGRSALLVSVAGVVLISGSLLDLGRSRDPFPPGLVLGAIEVGQGQALLVRTVDRKNLLVDGGGFVVSRFDVGKGVVAPCLVTLGVRRLDAVVLTHPHPDHGKGLRYILSHFEVGEFWKGPFDNELSEGLERIARARGIPVRVLSEASGCFAFGASTIRVLNPPAGGDEGFADLNNLSLVLKIESGGHSVLLTGDVEREAEDAMVGKYGPGGSVLPGALLAEAMSIPHHGSRSSSTPAFLAAVAPSYAVVSGGGPERSGLPNLETLDFYKSLGVVAGRTDASGFCAVVLGSGGTSLYSGPEVIPRESFACGGR